MIPLRTLRADPRDADLIDQVVGHLSSGGVIAYPTETVYGFGAAVTDEGVAAVRALKGRGDDQPFLSLVPSSEGLTMSAEARALAEAFWPGPLTLILPDPGQGFPEGARSAAGGVAVRVSSNEFVRALMEVWGRPLLSTSANRAGSEPARTARGVEKAVQGAERLDGLWILDGGPRVGSRPSTIVDCASTPPRLVRDGAIDREALSDVVPSIVFATPLSRPFHLLFVCTGNTCRSPLAMVLARRAVQERGLEGVEVRSAGVAALDGAPASGGSLRAARRHGLDLSAHRSGQVTPELVAWADLVLTMSPGHLVAVELMGGGSKAAVITEYVAEARADEQEYGGVPDPVGGDDEEYERTFETLARLIDAALDRLTLPASP